LGGYTGLAVFSLFSSKKLNILVWLPSVFLSIVHGPVPLESLALLDVGDGN